MNKLKRLTSQSGLAVAAATILSATLVMGDGQGSANCSSGEKKCSTNATCSTSSLKITLNSDWCCKSGEDCVVKGSAAGAGVLARFASVFTGSITASTCSVSNGCDTHQ